MYVLLTGVKTYIMKVLCKTLPVSHGNPPNPPPPEIIPYGKRSPLRITIWQTFPGRNPMEELPQGKQYHMVKFPPHKFYDEGTNTMADSPPPPGNDTIWQMFPMKEYHIMANLPPPPPPRKKSHGRTYPGGNNTIW